MSQFNYVTASLIRWFTIILILFLIENKTPAQADNLNYRLFDKQADRDVLSPDVLDIGQFSDNDKFMAETNRWKRQNFWSLLFGLDTTASGDLPHSSEASTVVKHRTHYPQMRLVPVDKRGIPIQLQRALYAHGIVGRRR